MISTWTPTPIPNYPSPGQQGWIPPPPACLLDALNTCQPGPPAYRPSILQTLLFLKKLCGLTFFLQTEVIHGLIRGFMLQDFPVSQHFWDAIQSCDFINLVQFKLILREYIIGGWKELDISTPHETHHSSRFMKTYHTHCLMYFWGLFLAGGMTEKEITSVCCLFIFA